MEAPCCDGSNSRSILDWLNDLPGATHRERCINGQEVVMKRMEGLKAGSEEWTGFTQILSHLGTLLHMDSRPFIGHLLQAQPEKIALAA